MLDFIKAHSVNGNLRYFNGSIEVTKDDFIDGEIAQLSCITSDNLKEKANVRFSEKLVADVNQALSEGQLKAASLFKQ